MRGGYYTPRELTQFIANWGIEYGDEYILEPSAGEGRFVDSAFRILKAKNKDVTDTQILAVEIDREESKKISTKQSKVVNEDFFHYYENELKTDRRFDIVIGNPPFIRYQTVDKKVGERAFKIMEDSGLHPNKMTNLWVPFLVASVNLLKSSGKLGMVIPAELLQVDYAAEIRKFLLENFEELNIIAINKQLFEDAQQEVVLILAKKKSINQGFKFIEIDRITDLSKNLLYEKGGRITNPEKNKDKWLKYFLKSSEFEIYEKYVNSNLFRSFESIAEVNVGVVTGQNQFFVLSKKDRENNSLKESSFIDIISRADQIRGIFLNQEKLEALYEDNKKVSLFYPEKKLSTEERKYISYGEGEGYNRGYKTRIRKEWYRVPISWIPEGFFLRQVHEFPKIVVNRTRATNTDTLHKVRMKDGFDIENLALSFLNSFTLLHAELSGRSYGGGVLTFEPGEVRSLKIPYHNFTKAQKEHLFQLIETSRIQDAIRKIDEIVLEKNLSIDRKDIDGFKASWKKLSQRRLNRKNKKV